MHDSAMMEGHEHINRAHRHVMFEDDNNNNDDDDLHHLDDDDDDDQPLLMEHGVGKGEEINGEKSICMTLKQAERLITYLNDASDLISQHLDEMQFKEIRKLEMTFEDNKCSRMKTVLFGCIKKFTGAKGITATIILQLVCLIMLTLVDALPGQLPEDKKRTLEFGLIVMLALQTLNLIIVILTTVQLVDQIQKREVSRMLLIQSYIATVLLFSGIYTATYRMSTKSWKFVEEDDINDDPVQIVSIYTRFLFFSVSTATLCGAADALPKEWYNCLFVSGQMLLSFMYFTSVLGTTLSKRRRPAAKTKALTKELVKLRESLSRQELVVERREQNGTLVVQ
ncbi:hypothetical protein ACF0H5_019359 [Mactra antiquata]